MGARERALQALDIVYVGRDQLGAECRERAGFDFTSRVKARAVKGPVLSRMMARTTPPPWAPVAPTTAMIFFSGMVSSAER